MFHAAGFLANNFSFFNAFHYVSVRAIAGLLSTLLFCLVTGNWFITKSKRFFRSKAREFTPESHKSKDDMPTMGGILIILSVVCNALLWCDWVNPQVWVFLWCLVSFGLIGFWDDWCKITAKKGISARAKFIAQWSVALLTVCLWLYATGAKTTVTIPFFKNLNPDLGIFFIPWAAFILVSCSNAVNLTDGLDGLAIGSLIPNFVTFALIAYLAGHAVLADYLAIPFAGSAEVAVLGALLVGASFGFLWFNAYPAQIFMGDVGSLALGASLALMALMAKQELLFPIAGGLFVLETVSVMVQVFVYRTWRKRIFKMAPIHHHFELLGWPEAKITTRFGIISIVLCLLALITLKLR
jgi:phospho-N-acetylmuramoyl-pentapeptide-transferase